MYAIVKTGGKQYKVAPGDVIDIEKVEVEPGKKLTLDAICIVDGSKVEADPAKAAKTKVEVVVLDQFKADKQLVFKFKKRKNYKKLRGHRQNLTRVQVESVGTAKIAAGDKRKPVSAAAAAKPVATATKPAAKKPAAKPASTAKTATAAKKPAAKPAAAKKPAAKTTTAAKKPAATAAKKPAAKKPAAKTTAAKKPAAKTTAAKKPAAKKTSTSATKAAPKKSDDAK